MERSSLDRVSGRSQHRDGQISSSLRYETARPATEEQTSKAEREKASQLSVQGLQRAPGSKSCPSVLGVFPWPPEEGMRPEDLLGPRLEHLDPLRKFYGYHIYFDRQLSCIKIMPKDHNDISSPKVKNLLRQLEIVLCECATIKSIPCEVHLLDLPRTVPNSRIAEMVHVAQDSSGTPRKVPVMLQRRGEYESESSLEALRLQNENFMRSSLKKCLSRLVYSRGCLNLRTLLGSAWFEYCPLEGPASLEEVSEKLRSYLTSSGFSQLPASQHVNDLYPRILQAEHLLKPVDYTIPNLLAVKPTVIGRYTIPLGKLAYKLEVEAESASSGAADLYTITSKVWTKQAGASSEPLKLLTVPLQSSLIDGILSWRLEITKAKQLNQNDIQREIARAMYVQGTTMGDSQPFGDTIQLVSTKLDPHTTGMKFRYKGGDTYNPAILPPIFSQKTIWRFNLRANPEFVFEVARYESFGSLSRQFQLATTSPRVAWGASLCHRSWSEILASNAALGVGEKAQWGPDIETFFPPNPRGGEEGFSDYIRNVSALVEFLNLPSTLKRAP